MIYKVNLDPYKLAVQLNLLGPSNHLKETSQQTNLPALTRLTKMVYEVDLNPISWQST